MEKRVEIFSRYNTEDLKSDINTFLDVTEGKLHDIIYQAAPFYREYVDPILEYSAIIVYTPEGHK